MSYAVAVAQGIGRAIVRNTAFAGRGAAVTLSLHTGDPGRDGANEVTGGSYAAQAITFADPTASLVSVTNTTLAEFTLMPGVTVTHFGVKVGGVFVVGGDATDCIVQAGNTARAAIGAITLTPGTCYSTALAQAIIRMLVGNTQLAAQGATLSLALYTADPGRTGANEVAGGSYAPATITFADVTGTTTTFANSSAAEIAGMPDITVTHWGVKAGATFLFGGDATDVIVQAGNTARAAVGALTLVL